jgi:hypothetical protein
VTATYISLVNELLRRLNEVQLDTGGQGFDTVRNVQALAKDAINNSIRLILHEGQEWPFLKTTYTQTLSAGTRTYNFPANFSSVDWDTFYLKKLTAKDNEPMRLFVLTYPEYINGYRHIDENAPAGGLEAPRYVYQTYEAKFGVTPVPDDAYEVEYVYFSYPADLVNYNDTCNIPDRFRHVIIDGAMMFMMRHRSNEQSAGVHQGNFEQGIRTMRRLLMDDMLEVRSTFIERPFKYYSHLN